MAALKNVMRRPGVQNALSVAAAGYIRFVHATSRWEMIGGDVLTRYWDNGTSCIPAFWHGRLMMMSCGWRKGVPASILLSQHRDGRFIAQTVERLGIQPIYGSTSRGGAAGLRAVIRTLQSGTSTGFTPDGPRGPRMRASLGVIQAARLSGSPILPCSFAVRRRRVLKSWDRFILALPFTRGVFVCGEPVLVPRNASDEAIETARQLVEDRLNAVTEQADRLVGVEPVTPAPVPAPASAARS